MLSAPTNFTALRTQPRRPPSMPMSHTRMPSLRRSGTNDSCVTQLLRTLAASYVDNPPFRQALLLDDQNLQPLSHRPEGFDVGCVYLPGKGGRKPKGREPMSANKQNKNQTGFSRKGSWTTLAIATFYLMPSFRRSGSKLVITSTSLLCESVFDIKRKASLSASHVWMNCGCVPYLALASIRPLEDLSVRSRVMYSQPETYNLHSEVSTTSVVRHCAESHD